MTGEVPHKALSSNAEPKSQGQCSPGEPPVLRIVGVSKSFGTVSVLEDFNLEMVAGENLAILGRSGIGKSVLLKLITGLLKPDRGEIYLWGEPTSQCTEADWKPLRRRLGMVFQSGALFDSMTVGENVAYPLQNMQRLSSEKIAENVAETLEWVDLGGMEERYPHELSGGQRRRVALARTISFGPEFVLYDEPTTGLDPTTARRISRLMRNLDAKLCSTSILVTHDIPCARCVSHRWAYLSGGRVLVDGTPETLIESSNSEVREFFHDEEEPAR